MLISKHCLLSIILLPLIYFYGLWILISIIINILLDFDHYLAYVLKFKNFDLKKAQSYFKNIGSGDDLAIFHTIEFIIIISIFSIFSKTAFFILIGTLFHISTDIIDASIRKIKRPFSILTWLRRNLRK